MVLKHGVELRDEVSEGSEGKPCSRDGALAKGRCPGKGRPFGHVRKGESDLFIVVIIDRLIDEEVELHSVQPVLRFFIGSIKRFGGADAQLSGFRGHGWRWGKVGKKGWWWRWWWKGKEGGGSDRSRRRWSGSSGNGKGGRELVG